MARAFADDPVLSWLLRADARLEQARLRYFELAFALQQRHELVFCDASYRGAALWVPPDAWRMGFVSELRLLPSIVAMAGLSRVTRALRVLHTMESRHAQHAAEPHYYLFGVGVDPAHHGRGLGGALVSRGVVEADARGLAAYLECSNERNLTLYRRLGFEVLEEIGFGSGSPRMWLMRRDARQTPL